MNPIILDKLVNAKCLKWSDNLFNIQVKDATKDCHYKIMEYENFDFGEIIKPQDIMLLKHFFNHRDNTTIGIVHDIMFDKMFDFWYNNKEFIKLQYISESYEEYKKHKHTSVITKPRMSNLKWIRSTKPFYLINTRTGKAHGAFYTFSLDIDYYLADVSKKPYSKNKPYGETFEYHFSNHDILDWKLGNYKFIFKEGSEK